ncbi:MAG: mechanosensitive ion channel family protein, partial [Myxococcota bacterium]
AIFTVVSRWVSDATKKLLERFMDNKPIAGILSATARVAVIGVGVFAALSLLHLDKAVTSLLAGVGVVGLAIGFAFQDIAANFISGLIMAVRRPFDVGDLIEIGDRLVRVDAIRLRATHVTTPDGLSLIVPNRKIFQEVIVNYTKTTHRRLAVEVGVSYDDDLEKVADLTRAVLEKLESRLEDRPVEVMFTEFGSSSINLMGRVWLKSSEQRVYLTSRSDAIMGIKKAYDEAGISIPFPIRTLDFGAKEVGGSNLASNLRGFEVSHAAE